MEVELLYKKIEGTLTPEESDAVEAWLASSPAHLAYFRRLKIHYEEGNDFVLPTDTVSLYRERFDDLVGSRFKKRRWLNFSVGMIAASFLIVAVTAAMFFLQTDDIESTMPEAVAEICIPLPDEAPDTVPLYTEKKTNGRIHLAVGGKVTYGLSEIYENHVDDVEYDTQNCIVSYKKTSTQKPVEMHRLYTDPGAELCLRLEDGTVVWLNSGTEIEYPSRFCGADRRVSVKGEAYFEVSKDSVRPFIVSAGNMDIKVYGTEFNVNTRRDSMTTTTLVEGSVSITPAGSGTETFLEPGEIGKLDETTGNVEVCTDDMDLYIGWRHGTYHFSNNSLESLFNELSLWYGIEVSFADSGIKNELFSGIISRNMPLMDLLNILSHTNYVEFDLKGKKLMVKEKKI